MIHRLMGKKRWVCVWPTSTNTSGESKHAPTGIITSSAKHLSLSLVHSACESHCRDGKGTYTNINSRF